MFGMSKVDVQQLFDALRAEGHLEIIGTEASIIESKWRRCVKRCLHGLCRAWRAVLTLQRSSARACDPARHSCTFKTPPQAPHAWANLPDRQHESPAASV